MSANRYEFKLPDLGEGIAEAEILQWFVDLGARAEEDEPLVEVETDKASVSIPSPVTGLLVERAGEPGDVVQVGQVLAVFELEGQATHSAPEPEEVRNAAALPSSAEAAAPAHRETHAHGEASQPATASQRASSAPPAVERVHHDEGPVPAAPAVRRLAREMGIDLRDVPGTGPGGRVTRQDLLAFSEAERSAGPGAGPRRQAAEPAPAAPAAPARASSEPSHRGDTAGTPAGLPYFQDEDLPDFEAFGPVERIAFRSVRRKVARKMATAHLVVPQVTHTDEADITDLEAWRRQLNARLAARGGPKVTVTALVVYVLPSLLKKYPAFNASLDHRSDELVLKRYYHIGVAADSPKGLVVPVVRDVDRLSLLAVAEAVTDVAQRAREERLEAKDFMGGTFTVSNIGALGGFSPNPIVNYPEVALLGMGRAKDKAVVKDGEIRVRRMLPLALTFDHRIADGADAARMLSELVALLEDPALLLASA